MKALAAILLCSGASIAAFPFVASQPRPDVDLKLFSAGSVIEKGDTELVARVRNATGSAITFEVSRNSTEVRAEGGGLEPQGHEPGLHHAMVVVVDIVGDLPEGLNTSGRVDAGTKTVKAGETLLLHFMIPRSRIPSDRVRVWIELREQGSDRVLVRSNVLNMEA